MEQRTVGKSALKVSIVGLGGNNFGRLLDLEASRKVIHKALDLGITFFDTGDIYGNIGGSESYLGQSLGDRRKDIVLATKFGKAMDKTGTKQGASRRYIMSAIEESLRRLKTDWIDLYQIHVPDPLTPIEETLRALEDLIKQGKVRHIGCSQFVAWQIVEAQLTSRHHGLHPFVSCQCAYNLLKRELERDLAPVLQSYDVGLLPYFPLACGLLTGKYKRTSMPEGARLTDNQRYAVRYLTDANWGIVEQLEKFSAERGHTLLELAFGWMAANPLVASVMAGATRPEQLELNVRAVQWSLTAEEIAEIDRLSHKA